MLLEDEDSPPPKKRSVGEASKGEVEVVDKLANTKKTKWPPKSTKSWSVVVVVKGVLVRCATQTSLLY